ncbi:MAG: hypothetical protein JXA25_08000 [Anaerolineales bacterium]|nr:hypothetical protein [Anaerolineales bacterium]
MKKIKHLPFILMASFLVLSMLACGLEDISLRGSSDLSATQTLDAVSTIAAATLQAMERSGDTEAAAEDETATVESPPVEEPPEATPSPTIEIIHITNPGDPASTSYYVIDSSTAAYASEHRSIADAFTINLLERPFAADGMIYQPYLDITRAELYISSPWVYLTIFLEDSPPPDSTAWYAMEVDLDMDGRGNVLVAAALPSDTTWTTDGVQVFKDGNFDVGGAHPMQNDSPPQVGDGYETVVFDQGLGDDPDAAWVRIAPEHPDRVQLGFKYTLLNSDDEFLWGAWTDEGVQEAGWFDYHDHFTQAEAGSPLTESSDYPLAAMDSMDNTCRWTYGFQPTDPLPGLCPLPTTPTPTPTTPPPVTIQGRVYDVMGPTGFSGVTVHLWKDSCGGSGHRTTSTSGSGWYSFADLEPGTYCVKVFHTDLPPRTYGWSNTIPGSGDADPTRTITLNTPGSIYNTAHFGFIEHIG